MFAIVVPTMIMTFMASVPELAFWRFIQGLLLPPIFTVTVAYIGDEWPPGDVARVAGLYVSGVERRRILRPLHSRAVCRPDRLARRHSAWWR